jgi:Mrp family chromosome partitioning ATPase
MDFNYHLRLLLRRLLLIGAVGLAAALLTYNLLGRRPVVYKSTAILATGIVNYKGLSNSKNEGFVQPYMVDNAFSNMMDYAKSRTSLKLHQIYLLRHDLEAMYEGHGEPFRQPNRGIANYTDDEAKAFLKELQKINLDSITDPSFDQDVDNTLNNISVAYGYDHDAILRQVSLARRGQTDYIAVTAVTESPRLSMHMANSFVQLFTNYYKNLYLKEKRQNYEFYAQLTDDKRKAVDSIQDRKFGYLYKQGLPALGKQSEEVIAQLTQLEMGKQVAEAETRTAMETGMRLDQYLGDLNNAQNAESLERIRQRSNTDRLSRRVHELSRQNTDAGGSNSRLASELSAAQAELQNAVRTSAGEIGRVRNATKEVLQEDLYRDKIAADMRRIEAENQARSIDNEIKILRSKLGAFVVNDAVATDFEAQQERAEEEFAKVNEEMVKAKLELENAESPLFIIENAQYPGWPEPTHLKKISAFAGVVGAILAAIGVLLLAFLDPSVQTPDVFAQKTNNLPLIGCVTQVASQNFDVRRSFSGTAKTPAILAWQEYVRKLRNELKPYEGKVLLFVSPNDGEGKTFLMTSLAYSLAANGQRVLLIDTNFKAPMPTELTDMPSEYSETLNTLMEENQLDDVFKRKNQSFATAYIDVLGHLPAKHSPSEMLPIEGLQEFLKKAKKQYAYVFMEAAGLNNYVDARELAPFADKILGVFSAKKPIGRGSLESIEYLRGLDGKFAGSVLNQVDPHNLA